MAVFSIIVFRQLVEDLNFVLGETGLGVVMACSSLLFSSSLLFFLLARELVKERRYSSVLDNIIWYSEGGTPQWDIRDKLGTCPPLSVW